MIAASGRSGGIRGGEQRGGLGLGEVGDQPAVEALGWDRQDARDHRRVLGVAQRGELEQRMHRGQSGVAGADAVAAVAFQVVEERADHQCVQVADVQLRVPGALHRDRDLPDHGSHLVQRHRDRGVLVSVDPDNDAPTKWVSDARHWLRVLPGLRGHGAAGRADRTVMGPAVIRLL
jgi:hypothetical protein